MAVQMIIKYADTEKKVVGKKNIIDEINIFSKSDNSYDSELCRKRVAGSNHKLLLSMLVLILHGIDFYVNPVLFYISIFAFPWYNKKKRR